MKKRVSKTMLCATDPIRLLIVDDHAVVRGGLEGLLAVAPGIGGVATASDGAEALLLCDSFGPQVVLLDLRMPGMDGHSALEAITSRHPQIRVIVLTGNDTPADEKLAKRNGACGFLSKSVDPPTLLRVIRKVAEGGNHFSARSEVVHQESCGLSGRELEVLRQLVRGLTNDQIGTSLGISSETIKSHLKSIFTKLATSTRAEAVNRAHELGLV